MAMAVETSEPILVAGEWRAADETGRFQALNPGTVEPLAAQFPVSSWEDCDAALAAAVKAADTLRTLAPEQLANFLETYADSIDAHASELAEVANAETALPVDPRLAKVEIPRTSSQLRQAAEAARTGNWSLPTIDTKANIRSCYEPLGPVCVFGPNNFPFAFNGISGGDFAAAIAAGNPVIAKANTSHPATTKRLAELAHQAVSECELPLATVQLLYRTSHDVGAKLVSDPRIGASGYTGSRKAGLALKSAGDAAGKPIYLELSSVNPVVLLPGSLVQRGAEVVNEFLTSVLMGTGQFCTNPGLVVTFSGAASESFVESVREHFKSAQPGTLLSLAVQKSLASAIQTLVDAGAELLCGSHPVENRCSVQNTLLKVDGKRFLKDPKVFQTEAFGNATLVVEASDVKQAAEIIRSLEGNLTGCIYSATDGSDDAAYQQLAPLLTQRVGRLLNDKMPTGVAVSPAMNHGGPYPATGHPGFTAVGIPASLIRFAKLTCYDNVRPERLPKILQDQNVGPKTYRCVDLEWTNKDLVVC